MKTNIYDEFYNIRVDYNRHLDDFNKRIIKILEIMHVSKQFISYKYFRILDVKPKSCRIKYFDNISRISTEIEISADLIMINDQMLLEFEVQSAMRDGRIEVYRYEV